MKRSLLLIAVLIGMCMQFAIAQDKKAVSGTVQDEKGNALPGVTVAEKGTTNGGITDANGNFSIRVNPNATLSFSFLGFLPKEISVASGNSFAVVLAEDAKNLTEFVVTGFGTKKDLRRVSYAIQEVKGDDLTRASNANVVNALTGKVAGVFINAGNGGPMSSATIRIRGNSSLRGNTQPLIVVDGVILEPGTSGADSWGANQDFGNQMKNLNSDDYESVTVLKGSAASALYGSQAQNGVLLITTKKGRARKGLGVTLSHSQTYDKAYKTMDLQNEFGAGINPTFGKDADGNDIVDPANFFWSFGPQFKGQTVKDIDGRTIQWNAKPNNVLDAFQVGRFINTNVAVEGGNEKGSFRASYSNLYNTFITSNNSYLKRDNFAIRAIQKVTSFINLDASVNYSMSSSRNPAAQGGNSSPMFALAYFNPRSYDTKYWMQKENWLDPNGGVAQNDPYGLGSIFFAQEYNNTVQNEKTLLANLDITTNITPWLTLLLRGNINDANIDRTTENWGTDIGFAGGEYSIRASTRRNTRLQALLSADRKLTQNLSLSVSVGGESQRYQPERYSRSYTNGGLKTPGKFFLGNSVNAAGTEGGIVNGSSKAMDAIYLYGDLTWKEMLTLNFSARNDWNSTLMYPRDGHGDPSYFYPGVGLSWSFSELLKDKEGFDFLSFGKLRASYAVTGLGANPWQTGLGNYAYLGNYNYTNGTVIARYGFDGSQLVDFNLKNENTYEFEVGMDLRFLDNRIGIDASYYKKNSKNQLLALGVPVEAGISSQLINAGNIQNQGIEVMLTAEPIRSKNLDWNMSFNFARNRNKVISLAPGVTSYNLEQAFGADMYSVARPGKDYGTIITGYAYATYQAKDASGAPVAHANNGQKVLKQNGSYFRSVDYGQGQKELGTMMEKFMLSTLQTVRYKNFTVGVQVDSKIGGMMASATHQYGSNGGTIGSTLFGRSKEFGGLERKVYTNGVVTATFDDGIIPEGVFDNGIKITAPNGQVHDVSGMSYADAVKQGIVEPVSARLYYARLTQWGTGIREYSTFENSWVAVREVSVGYTMPAKTASMLKLNTLRVSLVGRNLGYLYSTTKDHINPETGLLSNRAGTFAEYGGLPYIRSLGFKVDASF